MVTYACDLILMCVEFRDEILLRGEECKTREKNSIFFRKGKTVISIENRKFSKPLMTKRTVPLNSSREI